MVYHRKHFLRLSLALMAAAIVLIAMFCAPVSAKTKSGKCGKNVKWTLTDKGVLTISGKGAMYNYDGIDSPSWCSYIGYPSNIESVIVKQGVTTIGSGTFDHCFSACNITSVTLPNTLTSIGSEAFRYSEKLNKITIPKSVVKIGSGAFSGSGLKTVNIPDSVKKKINIANVFNDTPWLESNYPKSGKCGKNLKWKLNNKGVLTISGKGAMKNYLGGYYVSPAPWYCKKVKSVIIKSGVTTVGDCAFEYCWNVKKTTLPKGLTRIGEDSFRECMRLTSVKIPDSVTSIDGYAFYECQNLKKVTFPKNLTYVGICAFETERKAKLKTIIIPSKKIKTIEQRAFGWAHDDEYTSEWKDRGVVIKGYPNTASEKYAKKNKFKFVYLKKVANTLKIKGKTVKIKRSKLKKKKRTLKVTKAIKFIKKGQGKKTYTKISGNKKIMINKKTGKVTIKKGLKKRTYKVKVKVRAAGNAKYKALTKNVIIKIKVK